MKLPFKSQLLSYNLEQRQKIKLSCGGEVLLDNFIKKFTFDQTSEVVYFTVTESKLVNLISYTSQLS